MNKQQETSHPSIRKRMITGSLWMVGMRWAMQAIGLVSTMILARVLTPADFGIVAMGMLIVGLLEVFSSLGVDIALIRNQDATRKHYDTAWTFRVIQGCVIALLLVLSAPLMADYFNEPKVTLVIQILSLAVLFDGFENIGIVAFRKELDFSKEFRFGVYKKVLVFFITVPLALALENYWALVTGIVTGRLLGIILSYRMHPYRPRFCLKAAAELWSFSQWILILSIANYIQAKLDEFIVGGTKDTTRMGAYNVAADLAMLPNEVLVAPLARALIPGYSKLMTDKERLSAAFLKVVGMTGLVAIPACIGLMAVSEDIVMVILGDQWMASVPVLQWLALFCAIISMGSLPATLLVTLGKVRSAAVIQWSYLLVLTPALFFIGMNYGISEIAETRALVSLTMLIAYYYYLTSLIPLRVKDYAAVLWRPIIASISMFLAVKQFHNIWFSNAIFSLAADVIIGAFTFSILIILLWRLSGKPDGAEATVLSSIIKTKT